jgi:hypothetical protein
MNEKKIVNYVCVKCIDNNKEKGISPFIKILTEFGVCDCCGEHGVIVPFKKVFRQEVTLTPHTKAIGMKKCIDDISQQLTDLAKSVEIFREDRTTNENKNAKTTEELYEKIFKLNDRILLMEKHAQIKEEKPKEKTKELNKIYE